MSLSLCEEKLLWPCSFSAAGRIAQIWSQLNQINRDYDGSGLSFSLAGITRRVSKSWHTGAGPYKWVLVLPPRGNEF